MFVICHGEYSDMEIDAVAKTEEEAVRFCAIKNSSCSTLFISEKYFYREIQSVEDILCCNNEVKPYYLYSMSVSTNGHYNNCEFYDVSSCILDSDVKNEVWYHHCRASSNALNTEYDDVEIICDSYNCHEFTIRGIKLHEKNDDLAVKIAQDKFYEYMYNVRVVECRDKVGRDDVWVC